MLKRIFLFLLVNCLVLVTINITLSLFQIKPYLSRGGINYQSLLLFCAIIGFSGALISLALSRWMARFSLGVELIDPRNPGGTNAEMLLQMVYRLSEKAGLPAYPQVGIYQSPEVNAFATGPSRSRSLVAVSSGCLEQMDEEALEGVLGHEITHVANGDMVTMTLLQGVVNTFVLFFAKIAAWALSQAMAGNRDRDEGPNPLIYMLSDIAFQICFSLLGSIVVLAFSRWREYRADRGGAKLAGKTRMIHALESLGRATEEVDPRAPALAAFKISSGKQTSAFMQLLRSHPPLELRIEALKRLSLP